MHIPCLIVGAGPSGLMMAVLLHRLGIQCRIVDQKAQLTKTSNAIAVQTRTLEVWRDLGFADTAISRGLKITGGVVHAAGKESLSIDFSDVPSTFPFALSLPQFETETLLNEELEKLQGQVEWSTKLSRLDQDENGITALIEGPKGQENITADWLIACDGYHGMVRSFVGADYEGTDLQEHFIMMDVPIKSTLPKDKINIFFSADGAMIILPMENCCRIIAEINHDHEFHNLKQVTLDHFKAIAKKRCEVPLEFGEPVWQSGFWVHERITKNYRYGRVFLVGDAAHAHSPAGGQGMNTGLQDAHNLAWKLAMVMQNKAKEQLLDTYHQERHPVALHVIHGSTRLTHMSSIHNKLLLALRSYALNFVEHKPKIKQKIANTVSEVNVYYDSDIKGKPEIGKRLIEFPNNYTFVLALSAQLNNYAVVKAMVEQNYKGLINVQLMDTALQEKLEKEHPKADYYLIRPDQYLAFYGNGLSELQTFFANSYFN